jgi:hypothetical protein
MNTGNVVGALPKHLALSSVLHQYPECLGKEKTEVAVLTASRLSNGGTRVLLLQDKAEGKWFLPSSLYGGAFDGTMLVVTMRALSLMDIIPNPEHCICRTALCKHGKGGEKMTLYTGVVFSHEVINLRAQTPHVWANSFADLKKTLGKHALSDEGQVMLEVVKRAVKTGLLTGWEREAIH